jgi:hypothetical protein
MKADDDGNGEGEDKIPRNRIFAVRAVLDFFGTPHRSLHAYGERVARLRRPQVVFFSHAEFGYNTLDLEDAEYSSATHA